MIKIISINNNSIRYDRRFEGIPLELSYGEAVDIEGSTITFMYNENYSHGFKTTVEELENFLDWLKKNRTDIEGSDAIAKKHEEQKIGAAVKVVGTLLNDAYENAIGHS